MTKISGTYLGDLRNAMSHLGNENTIETDAPIDNEGKGARFSPTDLLAAGLGSCMMTILAIRAKAKNIAIGNPSYQIEKHMQSNPRKISKISVTVLFDVAINDANRLYLEKEARNCPVALSLSQDLVQDIEFSYT